MSVRQVDAVVETVKSVLGPTFQEGKDDARLFLTKGLLNQVYESIYSGIMSGTINFKGDTDNTVAVKNYVRSLVSNHLRRSKKLNGGKNYKVNQNNTNQQPIGASSNGENVTSGAVMGQSINATVGNNDVG